MTHITFDNVALGLAVLAVLFRALDRAYASNLAASLSLLASTVAGWLARRRRAAELARALADAGDPRPATPAGQTWRS